MRRPEGLFHYWRFAVPDSLTLRVLFEVRVLVYIALAGSVPAYHWIVSLGCHDRRSLYSRDPNPLLPPESSEVNSVLCCNSCWDGPI